MAYNDLRIQDALQRHLFYNVEQKKWTNLTDSTRCVNRTNAHAIIHSRGLKHATVIDVLESCVL